MGKEISIDDIILAQPDNKPKVDERGMRGSSTDAWHYGASY